METNSLPHITQLRRSTQLSGKESLGIFFGVQSIENYENGIEDYIRGQTMLYIAISSNNYLLEYK